MRMLSALLDPLFPPRETEKLVRNIDPNNNTLYSKAGYYKNTLYVLDYQKPIVRALIAENKFYQNTRATKILGNTLNQWVMEQPKNVIFVPIPLSKKRQKERGYNQVTEIIKRLPSKEVMVMDVLERTKHTKPQTELNKAERLTNMKDVFEVNHLATKVDSDSLVVIIDDVVTTGATIFEARATLAPHIPNTTVLTLALAH